MIFKTEYFDVLTDAIRQGGLPVGPSVGGVCTIKGQEVKIEESLAKQAKVVKALARLDKPDVRFHFVGTPAREVAGPLCLLTLMVHHRLVDVFMVGYDGFYVVVAVYCDEPKAAIRLVHDLRDAVAKA